MKLEVYCNDSNSIYFGENISVSSSEVLSEAKKSPTSKDKIISQISKTGNTPFEFSNIDLILDDNLFVPVAALNELRRTALEKLMKKIIDKEINSRNLEFNDITEPQFNTNMHSTPKVNLLLNILRKDFDYALLTGLDKLFIPLKYFMLSDYRETLQTICKKFKVYVYMPNIMRDTKKVNFDNILESFNLCGFVISSISQLSILEKYNLDLIGNYTLNVYNKHTIDFLKFGGLSEVCITPELNDFDTQKLIDTSPLPLELMVYGKIPFMTMNYCLLGKSNKCYKECSKLCTSNKKFFIKDRLGLDFRIIPDNSSTITTIYNSKITSFDYTDFKVNSVRISILDESLNQIQEIIDAVKLSKRFEGKEYCGHFNK